LFRPDPPLGNRTRRSRRVQCRVNKVDEARGRTQFRQLFELTFRSVWLGIVHMEMCPCCAQSRSTL
jgi:hypothetical protein